jgi:type III restriction enzyme
MAIHPNLPKSPYAVLEPAQRWFPAAEDLRSTAYEKLLPPLVAKIREDVSEWRAAGYLGVSATSKALLQWWFHTQHLTEQADGSLSTFEYYFAQREAVETIIWLHDVRRVRDKFDLMRFDASVRFRRTCSTRAGHATSPRCPLCQCPLRQLPLRNY